MVIPKGVNIPMPPPYGGNPPIIAVEDVPGMDGGKLYTVQFVGEIGPVTQYLELFQLFDMATEQDKIVLEIDSPGGDVYTAQQIVERMDSCKAQVTTDASGLVASAATFVWCAGKEKKVGRWGRFMFHSSLHGDWGKSLAIKETATELVNYMASILTSEMKAGILLGAEVAKILKDKADVEIAGAVMAERIAKVKAEGEEQVPANPEQTPAETQPAETTPATTEATPAPAETTPPATTEATPATTTEPAPAETTPAPAEGGEGEVEFDPEAIFKAEGIETEPVKTPEVQPTEGGEKTEPATATPEPAPEVQAKCGKGKEKAPAKKEKLYKKVVKDDGSEEFVEVPAEEPAPATTEPAPATTTEEVPPATTETTTPPAETTPAPTEPNPEETQPAPTEGGEAEVVGKCGGKAKKAGKKKALKNLFQALEGLLDEDIAESEINVGTEPEEAKPEQTKQPTLPGEGGAKPKEAPATTETEKVTTTEKPIDLFDPEAIFKAEGIDENGNPIEAPAEGQPAETTTTETTTETTTTEEVPANQPAEGGDATPAAKTGKTKAEDPVKVDPGTKEVTKPGEADKNSNVEIAPKAPEGRYW